MTSTTLDAKVQDFLAQQRIAVAGVSRDNGRHPAGNLICRRLKKSGYQVFALNPMMQTFDGDRCYPDLPWRTAHLGAWKALPREEGRNGG